MSWKNEKLVNIISAIKTGSTPPTKKQEYFNGNVDWYVPEDIGNLKYLENSSRHISNVAITEKKIKLLSPGTLLITCIGEIGRVGLLKKSSYFNQQITGLNFKDDICEEYAYYWFLKNKRKLERNSNNALVPILNNERLLEIDFTYPENKNEQKRIVSILDKADRIRRLRKYALKLTDLFLQSVFLEMFGNPEQNNKKWDIDTIESVIESSDYGTSNASNDKGFGVPILGMGNITYDGLIDLSNYSYVELEDKKYQKLKLNKGDILFNRTNSTELVGKTAKWDFDIDAVPASYLVKITLKEGIMPDYFVALLNTPFFKKLFQVRCKKGVNQSNISPTLLKEFKIMLPPKGVQQDFKVVCEKLNGLRYKNLESLRQSEMLFQSLLHRAFSGELSGKDEKILAGV